MIKITATDASVPNPLELVLVDDANRPTATLLALAALELTLDCLIGYAAYRFFKARNR